MTHARRRSDARDTMRFRRGLTTLAVTVVALLGLGGPLLPSRAVAGVPAAEAPVVRIMPLGDSITEAERGHASYRYWLWKSLSQAGYVTDFVGSQYGVYNGAPLYPDFDHNHEGHWGWRADEILGQVEAWSRDAQPDVVLLHLGTNDIFQGDRNASTIDEIGQIIDKIRITNPAVTVLLAKLIPATYKPAEIVAFNDLIPALAVQKTTMTSPVVVVDQWSGYDAPTSNYDGTHPNMTGEQQMARRWQKALARVLPVPPSAPAPTATLGGARYLSDLAYTVAANGWGSAERDRSNGERAAGDGRALTLNGVTYPKGLGVHAASDVRYALGGACATFAARVGVDDEVSGYGSVAFQVWGDGVKLYDSGTMTWATATKAVSVGVAGRAELRLVVTDAGDGAAGDHADWADAKLTCGG